MPSNTSEYFPRPAIRFIISTLSSAIASVQKAEGILTSYGPHGLRTNLPHDLVVFQRTPGDINAVIIPVGSGHVFVDVCVHACHLEGVLLADEIRPQLVCTVKWRKAG